MELIDLKKILKVGDEVYSIIHGSLLRITAIDPSDRWSIRTNRSCFTKFGQVMSEESTAECVIFPSKTERDWGKYIQEKESQKLLEEAKLKYPIGIKVLCLYSKSLKTIFSHNELYKTSDGRIWIDCKNIRALIFENGKWAEIVKEPLFTTEDGVAVYGEELVWYCNKDYYTSEIISITSKYAHPGTLKNLIYFSTEQAAKDWKFKTFKDKSPFTLEQREEIIRLINMYK